jgi:hypothetical protein
MASKKRKTRSTQPSPTPRNALAPSFIAKALSFIASAGLLVYFIGFTSEYIRGDTPISFSQALGGATELVVASNWPMDRKIETLRFDYIGPQKYATRKDTVALLHADGTMEFPDSPKEKERSPAKEFSELDGSIIRSKEMIKFRLPPFTNSPLHSHRSGIVEFTVATTPVFVPFRWLENVLAYLGIVNSTRSQRFLVQENHWTPVQADYSKNPIELSCREQWAGPTSERKDTLPSCTANNSDLEWGPVPSDTGDATAIECTKHAGVLSPFTTTTEHQYIVGGKVRGTLERPDGSGKPLILYVVIAPDTKVVCERGRFVLFYDSLEAIKYFWRK